MITVEFKNISDKTKRKLTVAFQVAAIVGGMLGGVILFTAVAIFLVDSHHYVWMTIFSVFSGAILAGIIAYLTED